MHQLFLESSEQGGILLELELCTQDLTASANLLHQDWMEHWPRFPTASFRRFLFGQLAKTYNQTEDLRQFSRKTYLLWQLLPAPLQKEQPFWALSYADEPLSWGDEAQTRKIYEEIFRKEGNC